MRVGGPADLFATVHNVHELRAIVRFARSRGIPLTLLGRGSDVVIADAGIRGLVVQNRAEGSRIDGRPLHRRVGRADGPRRDRDAEGRPDRASSSGWRSRAPSAARSGPTPAPTTRDVAAILESADVLLADGTRGAPVAPTDLDLRYRDSRLKHRPDEVVLERDVPPRAGGRRPTIAGRLDEIRRWRREHQPLGIPSAGSRRSATRPATRPAALIDAAGLKGRRIGGATRLREARELHRQRPEGHGGRRPGGLVDEVARRRSSAQTGVEPRAGDRVPRRLGGAPA